MAGWWARPKKTRYSLQKLRLPGRDLVRVNIELLTQFDDRLLSLQRCQRHPRLREGRLLDLKAGV